MRRLIWLCSCLVLVGCGDVESHVSHVGRWRLAGVECPGHAIAFKAYSELLVLEESTGTTEVTAGGCTSRLNDYPVRREDDTLKLMTTAAQAISCTPNPCDQTVEVVFDGQVSWQTSHCPADLPSAKSPSTLQLDNDMLVQDVTAAGLKCTGTYVRQ